MNALEILRSEAAVDTLYQPEISYGYPHMNCKQGYCDSLWLNWLDRQSHMTSHQLANSQTTFLG